MQFVNAFRRRQKADNVWSYSMLTASFWLIAMFNWYFYV